MDNAHHTIADALVKVKARINAAEKAAGRTEGIVQLIGVSKTRSAEEIREAFNSGLVHFGENYLQEALPKQTQLADLAISWHFIGPIQSNKTADIAKHFDWVHSVDRLKIAKRISEQRPKDLPPINLCIQVNIDQEASKSGIKTEEVLMLAESIQDLPNVQLRGLMAIPSPGHDGKPFNQLYQLLNRLNESGFELDTLSMGMSDDLESAIASGATCVRIGTALFGPRQANA